MATKTFSTVFALAAKYTGKPAFDKLNRDIDRTQRNAAASARNIKGMFTAVKVGLAGFAGYAGYRAFRAAFDIGGKAIDAAKGVTKAHDQIRQSYARVAADQPKRQINIEEETKATIALAEAMEKAGGIDAETMGQTLADLSKYYSDTDIKKMSKGLQDWLVKVEHGAPTEEKAAERIANINKYIQLGTKEGLASLDLTKEQIASFKKYEKTLGGSSRAEARAAIVSKVLSKETGETARWMKSADGSAYRLSQSQEAWLETAGKSSAQAIPKLNDALADLIVAMQPVADLLDKEMSPHIKDLTEFIDKNKDSFVTWGNNAVWALDYVFENIERMRNVFWVFEHLIWLAQELVKLWDRIGGNEKIKGWTPGQVITPQVPAAMDWRYGGTTGAPTTKEEADRQHEAAKKEEEALQKHSKYPPYERESKAMQQVKRAELSGSLKQQRAAYAAELADPRVRQLVMASTQAEVGDQPSETQQAYIESIMNRAAAEKKSVEAIIRNEKYYPSSTKARLSRTFSGPKAEQMEKLIASAQGGSNIANYATGNESGSVRSGGAPILFKQKGAYERFVGENWTKDWIAKAKAADQAAQPTTSSLNGMIKGISPRQRLVEGSGGTNIASIAPVINIGSAGSPDQVQQKVVQGMRISTKELLDGLKRGKKSEDRGSYV